MYTSKELGLDKLGLINIEYIERNLPVERLIEDTILQKNGRIGMRGAVMVDTGRYTGRSPKAKYFVKDPTSQDHLWWGDVNQEIGEGVFDELYTKVINRYNLVDNSKTYIFDGIAGADPDYAIKVRMIAKKAWQAHFVHNMFIRPRSNELEGFEPDFTIINASDVFNENFKKHGMNSETFIIFHLEKKIAIIGGTEYGGEMKKGIFSVMNYYLPLRGVLSMHCSANVDKNGENPAIFFGLSGTGKTTLSTDPKRPLIGDDEHGWSDEGIFNFEGGCYAKVINLNPEYEPDIFNAIRHGALLENVVYNENTMAIDFTDGSKTENTRVSYPVDYIEHSLAAQGKPSRAGHPKQIIFLTCDAYGVLPPVSKLTPEQAMYHFASGYTAKVAGTERGITEPVATFSPCFGGPFLTLHPLKYAELLRAKMEKFHVPAYLVNTGWVGANANSGTDRISLPLTREIIHTILDGIIEQEPTVQDPYFGFDVPKTLSDIDPAILIPEQAWPNPKDYHQASSNLVKKFHDNFTKYDSEYKLVKQGGPTLKD